MIPLPRHGRGATSGPHAAQASRTTAGTNGRPTSQARRPIRRAPLVTTYGPSSLARSLHVAAALGPQAQVAVQLGRRSALRRPGPGPPTMTTERSRRLQPEATPPMPRQTVTAPPAEFWVGTAARSPPSHTGGRSARRRRTPWRSWRSTTHGVGAGRASRPSPPDTASVPPARFPASTPQPCQEGPPVPRNRQGPGHRSRPVHSS
jgi:hypothetical protein